MSGNKTSLFKSDNEMESIKSAAEYVSQIQNNKSILSEDYDLLHNAATPESERLDELIDVVTKSIVLNSKWHEQSVKWRKEDLISSKHESTKSTISLILSAIAALGVIVPFIVRILSYI